ncbi:MAG: KUP/HAK/KT family potassium transporter [Acidimicrobiia bacterium]
MILNYLGQGGFLLSGEKIRAGNLFFSTVPEFIVIPMVILATLATVIASQALITGAFSLASQGMAMNLIPKMRIVHTNKEHEGQIYIPFVNWSLFIGCIFLVLTFRSSSALASAYGLAVSAVMLVTTISMTLIALRIWKWNKFLSLLIFGTLGTIDFIFLFANIFKLLEGGYVPVIIGIVLATIMFTWNWGRRQVRFALNNLEDTTMEEFLRIKNEESEHFPRSIIMLTPDHAGSLGDQAPAIATLFKQRFDHLPRHLVLLTIRQKRHPVIDSSERYDIVEFDNDHDLDRSLLSIQVNFGYMEEPDVETIISDLSSNKKLSAYDDPEKWLIHAAKERVVVQTKAKGFSKFRYGLFRTLSRQAQPAYNYFGLDNDSRLSLELISVEL